MSEPTSDWVNAFQVAHSGARLDRYVSEQAPELSRATVQRLIHEAQILVDGVARKASYHVQAGETITLRISPPEPAAPRAEPIRLDILYEDDDLLVVNKPAGMVVHPAAGHPNGTLVNAVLAHAAHLNVGGVERPGIVHRLDSETSGIIVVAKNDAAMRNLQAQFKTRRVKKTYLALVEGTVRPPRGKIDAPIARDPKHRSRMTVATRGKTRASVTVYRTLANLGAVTPHRHPSPHPPGGSSQREHTFTLVEAQPQTGRTHQIRVHLAFLGFPVVADSIYGHKSNALGATRQLLHAWKIAFKVGLDGREVSFTAPLPDDMRDVLTRLGFDPGQLA